MTLFGTDGASLAGLVLACAAIPCVLLTLVWQRMPRTVFQVCVLAYGACAVASSGVFLTQDAQSGELAWVLLWFALIGAVVYSVCWAWKRERRMAQLEGTR